MSVVIWHNPRCSMSRATLALLEERGVSPEIQLYLVDPPSVEELRQALSLLGHGAADLVRKGEADYKDAGLTGDSAEEEIIAAMVARPKLIERPIVFSGGQARVGRPPEAVLDIL